MYRLLKKFVQVKLTYKASYQRKEVRRRDTRFAGPQFKRSGEFQVTCWRRDDSCHPQPQCLPPADLLGEGGGNAFTELRLAYWVVGMHPTLEE